MNSKRVGNIAEAAVLSTCVQQGWAALVPFGDVEPYDLVIDRGNGFERVQVKNGRLRKGVIIWNCYSISGRVKNQRHTFYQDKVDLFGVYCPELDKVYLVPVDIDRTKGSLRVDPPLNGQSSGIRWANDYQVS
jgi:hypothetical protein